MSEQGNQHERSKSQFDRVSTFDRRTNPAPRRGLYGDARATEHSRGFPVGLGRLSRISTSRRSPPIYRPNSVGTAREVDQANAEIARLEAEYQVATQDAGRSSGLRPSILPGTQSDSGVVSARRLYWAVFGSIPEGSQTHRSIGVSVWEVQDSQFSATSATWTSLRWPLRSRERHPHSKHTFRRGLPLRAPCPSCHSDPAPSSECLRS